MFPAFVATRWSLDTGPGRRARDRHRGKFAKNYLMTTRVAIVTGGARGIGCATSERLASDGFFVAVNYRTDETAACETVARIERAGGRAVAIAADITDLAANRALFETVKDRFGRIDILVNNAGVGVLGGFNDIDEAGYDRLFDITKATYFAMQNVMRHMSDNGRIINLSSGLTRGWAVGTAAYAGSKAAIEQFTRSLSKEAGARGITVNAVLPGVTRTDMTSGFGPALETARQAVSLGRLGEPDDIADVISFLAGHDGRWITGQLVVANGGSTP